MIHLNRHPLDNGTNNTNRDTIWASSITKRTAKSTTFRGVCNDFPCTYLQCTIAKFLYYYNYHHYFTFLW